MSNLLKSIFGLIFLASATFASKNVEVESRPLPDDIKKMMEEKKVEEEDTEKKHECDQGCEVQLQTGIFNNEYPPVYFPYSCHSVTAISAFGDSIALEDGSVWTVHPVYQSEVMIWKGSDALLIYPNKAWLSSYKYTIVNQTLKTAIEVNMTLGPLMDGEYSLQIVAIDYIKGEIYLNDNSRWKIYNSDKYLLNQWIEGDYLLVGSNNSWFCSLNNILINSNMYNHIRAQQF